MSLFKNIKYYNLKKNIKHYTITSYSANLITKYYRSISKAVLY